MTIELVLNLENYKEEGKMIRVNVLNVEKKCCDEKNLSELDRFIGLIGMQDRKYVDKIIGDNEMLIKLYKKVDELNKNEEMRKAYEEECLYEEILAKIVKDLLKEGVDTKMIARVTGLSVSEITSIKEEL